MPEHYNYNQLVSTAVDVKAGLDRISPALVNVLQIIEKNQKLATVSIAEDFLTYEENLDILLPLINTPSDWARKFIHLIRCSCKTAEWLNLLCNPVLTKDRNYSRSIQEILISNKILRPILKSQPLRTVVRNSAKCSRFNKATVFISSLACRLLIGICLVFSINDSNAKPLKNFNETNASCLHDQVICKRLLGYQTAIIETSSPCKPKCYPLLEGLQFKDIYTSIDNLVLATKCFQKRLKFLEFEGDAICKINSGSLSRVGFLAPVAFKKLETLSFANLGSSDLSHDCTTLYHWFAGSGVENLTCKSLIFKSCTFTVSNGVSVEHMIEKVASGGNLKSLMFLNNSFYTQMFDSIVNCSNNKVDIVEFRMSKDSVSETNTISLVNLVTQFLKNCSIDKIFIDYPLPFKRAQNVIQQVGSNNVNSFELTLDASNDCELEMEFLKNLGNLEILKINLIASANCWTRENGGNVVINNFQSYLAMSVSLKLFVITSNQSLVVKNIGRSSKYLQNLSSDNTSLVVEHYSWKKVRNRKNTS